MHFAAAAQVLLFSVVSDQWSAVSKCAGLRNAFGWAELYHCSLRVRVRPAVAIGLRCDVHRKTDHRPLIAVHCSYLLYSSSICCSLTGRFTSLRFGNESTRPDMPSKLASSHPGTGFWAAYWVPCSTMINFFAPSRIAISSPTFTWYEGMLTLRPLTCTWP